MYLNESTTPSLSKWACLGGFENALTLTYIKCDSLESIALHKRKVIFGLVPTGFCHFMQVNDAHTRESCNLR